MIKPDAYKNMGKILSRIEEEGFILSNLKLFRFGLGEAQGFYAEHRGKPFFEELTSFMASDFALGMELIAENVIQKWRSLIGPTNCQVARVDAPNSIRAQFGTSGVRNACHGSDASTPRMLLFKMLYYVIFCWKG